jgi:hypothetical protein
MAFNPAPKAVQENHHVDYVIRFNYGDIGRSPRGSNWAAI